MGRKIIERNTLTYGELPSFEAQARSSKRYRDGLQVGQGIDLLPGLGAKPSLAPGVGNVADNPISYRCDNIRGTWVLRNTTAGLTTPDNPFYPITDAGTEGALIDNILNAALATGNYRARVTAADMANWRDFPFGRLDMNKVATACIPAGTIVSVASAFQYYRGMNPGVKPGSGGGVTVAGWSIMGNAHCGWKEVVFGVTTDSGSADIKVLCRGDGPKTGYLGGNGTPAGLVNVWGSTAKYTYTVAPGVYLVTQDIYLIGRSKMFVDYPKESGANRAFSGSCLDYSRSAFGFTDHAAVPIGSLTDDDNTWILGYGTIDNPTETQVNAGNAAFTKTVQSAAGATFYFKGKTIVRGERRFGRASLYAQELYLGATKIGVADGRDTSLTAAGDAEAYVLQLDSGPIWLEGSAQGVVVGTATAEYLVANEQAKTSVRVQRISTVGCPAPSDNLLSASAMFEGNIFYISRYGITTIPFSNEAQAYLPRHFKTEGLRSVGAITSIAASIDERCLYFTCDDGTLWKLWPDSGAIAGVNLIEGDDVLKGVIQRDGVVFAVFSQYDTSVDPALYEGDYFSEVNRVRSGQSVIETTAFGRGPGVVARVNRVLLEVEGAHGGTVQLVGDGVEPARSIPYNVIEAVDGATGVKEIRVGGRPGKKSEGRAVRVTFEEADEFRLISISAETEVN